MSQVYFITSRTEYITRNQAQKAVSALFEQYNQALTHNSPEDLRQYLLQEVEKINQQFLRCKPLAFQYYQIDKDSTAIAVEGVSRMILYKVKASYSLRTNKIQ